MKSIINNIDFQKTKRKWKFLLVNQKEVSFATLPYSQMKANILRKSNNYKSVTQCAIIIQHMNIAKN